jgi:hypothetical protein
MESTSTGGARRFFTPRVLLLAAVIAAAGLAIVLVWFQPQKLFIDESVNEAAPGAMTEDEDAMAKDDDAKMKDDSMTKDDGAMKKDDSMAKDEAMMSFAGSFRSIDHETSGSVSLLKAPDGHYYVRLEDFRTENGPDLFVYLSSAPATAEGRDFAEGFVDLGPLKGNIGNQNYVVPDDTDLSKYRSVVIWCRRFTSPFGAAPLQAQ